MSTSVERQAADPMFFNADGSLTGYAYTCGYVSKHVTAHGEAQMWHQYGCFRVRTFLNGKLYHYKTTPKLTVARSYYRQAKQIIK